MSDKPKTYTLTFGSRIRVSKNKKISLNLNVYRNLHYHASNKIKKELKKSVRKQIKDLPKLGKISLDYVIFHNTKMRIDTMNVGSIANKFFEDALVELGIIPDDNHLYIDSHSFRFGGLRKTPQVEVIITEIEPLIQNNKKDKDMRILLDQEDIQTALETYVANQLGNFGECTINITFENDELIAEVIPSSETKPVKKTTGRRGRPKGSTNKSKDETDNAKPDTPQEDNSNSDNSDSSRSTEPTKESDTVPTKTSTDKASEDKKSKNLFEESPEEPSEVDDSAEEKEDPSDKTESKTVVSKKKSIFDAQ